MFNHLKFVFLLVIISSNLIGCGVIRKQVIEHPKQLWESEMEGYASWYGIEYHGRKTASGEIYNMYDLTAAHRTLPFGSIVNVLNLENGKDVDVRINDRGPFIVNRIIDLSYSSAKAIDMIKNGSAKVKLTLKELGTIFSSSYIIQVGSFVVPEHAFKLKRKIELMNLSVFIDMFESNIKRYYRVRIGPIKDKYLAEEIILQLRKNDITSCLILGK